MSPFGDERSDLQAGIIASTIANVHRGKNTSAFKPEDFMPYSKREPISDEAIKRRINKFMRRYH